MKALFELFRRFDARRIFGFIRRLGGMSRPKVKCYDLRSTRALRVEGDYHNVVFVGYDEKFLSTPSGWRATCCLLPMRTSTIFLSTPSGWRATLAVSHGRRCWIISIHALRVEGDQIRCVATLSKPYFYPRPPGGGRRAGPLYHAARRVDFYPRPPGGGRPCPRRSGAACKAISIHALRVEGDTLYALTKKLHRDHISIHALRVEGDLST